MRAWKVWLVFSLCLASVLGAVGWFAYRVIALEREELRAEQQAEQEEVIRLALWRMEYAVVPLIAQEAARPYFHYFPLYGADRAYSTMYRDPAEGEAQLPSPLLGAVVDYTRLHFQMDADGNLTSPQVPEGRFEAPARPFVDEPELELARQNLASLRHLIKHNPLRRTFVKQESADERLTASLGGAPPLVQDGSEPEFLRSFNDYQARRDQMGTAQKLLRTAKRFVQGNESSPRPSVVEGTIRPLWCGDALFLARHVDLNGQPFIQGCWVDRPRLTARLLAGVEDLLPVAELVPAPADDPARPGESLVSLPFRLLPGDVAALGRAPASPIRMSLLLALSAVLVAAIAVAVLLRVILSFSERRGAFVSAVTHELRTPLTTLRMYAQLLAEGRVKPEKHARYYQTLEREADRLGHLVENVLAYSRLEASGAEGRREIMAMGKLVDRVADRARERAEQAEMELRIEIDDEAREHLIRVDVSAVEQIVFNLVDNACKYAADAEDRTIRLSAETAGGGGLLRVRDHGPGISRTEAKRLFRPFSRSARQAARGKQGIGLGLALCRRLARGMRAELRLDRRVTDGAGFEVLLPAP